MLAAAVACLGFTGCATRYADVPSPTRYPNEDQLKIRAARHWQLISEHFAKQMTTTLKDKLNGRALYIPEPGGEQPFVGGFRELLITSLVAQGMPVSTVPDGALVADVRYSIYAFSPNRAAATRFYGEYTALTAGLFAVGGVLSLPGNQHHPADVAAAVLTTIAGVEAMDWIHGEEVGHARFAEGPVPQSEILLTVSVADNNRIISRQSSIYYTVDKEVGLYWNKPYAGHTIKVVGDCGQEVSKCAR